MSLGYVKGQYWVSDDYYKSFTEWDTYKNLVAACREAGITFDCQFSYITRIYTAEVLTIKRGFGNFYSMIKHANAYDEHPMLAVTAAIRQYPHNSYDLALLCLELDLRVISQKLLPLARLERSIEDLIAVLA